MPPKKDEKKKDNKKKGLDKNRKLGMGGTIGIVDKPNKCFVKSQPECPPPISCPPPSSCAVPRYPPQNCSGSPSRSLPPKKY